MSSADSFLTAAIKFATFARSLASSSNFLLSTRGSKVSEDEGERGIEGVFTGLQGAHVSFAYSYHSKKVQNCTQKFNFLSKRLCYHRLEAFFCNKREFHATSQRERKICTSELTCSRKHPEFATQNCTALVQC